RIPLPMTVEEYRVGQLYAFAHASLNETGGGDGVEVLKNEPYTNHKLYGDGQYTYKIYHAKQKVPKFIQLLAPAGSLEFHEEAWNAYPYCKTVITNPYMKDNFKIILETWHKPGKPEIENVHDLTPEQLAKVEVDLVDIYENPDRSHYNEEYDPRLARSEKSGRGPLTEGWMKTADPIMCAYKMVTVEFKWWGLQKRVENLIMKNERILFHNFHRQVFSTLDEYFNLNMEDIRELELKTKEELDKDRQNAPARGMVATE
ncbi:phosphatidylinositol transfer protein/retinal degeneration b protein, partial [Apostichopus japonicus]